MGDQRGRSERQPEGCQGRHQRAARSIAGIQLLLRVSSCVTSELSIVDDAGQKVLFTIANPLKITLRRDATTIPSGAKIRDAVLQGAVKYFPLIGYDANNNNEPVYGSPVTIFECSRYPLGTAHPETGTNPTVERCIKSYVAYKNSDAPTADYVGDWS